MSKKLYIIAGEASGDLHGSNLLDELLKADPKVEIRFWGGDKMASLAGKPVKHIKDLAFMGFWEVITNLKTIAKNIKFCKKDIGEFKPDALVLIDYPGFNLRIAEWAKKRGIKIYFYVSPQVWAWKENRVHKIKRTVDKLFAILPFEKAFYKKHDFDVDYVGHPLLDEVLKFKNRALSTEEFVSKNQLSDKPIIALLPGSRKQEINVKLPLMVKACEQFEDYQIVVAGAPNLDQQFYESVVERSKINVIYGQTYDILNQSTAALVTSGTATLETALLEVPQVVCYKGNFISYHIAKRLIKIDYISLVNLIMNEEVVTELIQDECNSERMCEELIKVLPNGNKRAGIALKYKELIKVLGEGGASKKVAELILKD
ncbi:MAG: lipid-A-disaccharide synthase [Psychromonas sp.]